PYAHLCDCISLSLARDIDLCSLYVPGFYVATALDAICCAIALELELGELMLIRANDFAYPVADRTRIDLDVIVRRRQLSQQCLGDFAIGRDNDLTILGVYDVKRDFFAQQDIRK